MHKELKMSNELHWTAEPVKALDHNIQQQALRYQTQLTKPQGSLGRLEQLAVTFAAMQGKLHPKLERIQICIFAGDHGVTAENISAFPQEVTAQMLENFVNEGAAISVLAKQLNAQLSVIDVGVNAPASASERVIHRRVVDGTANFAKQPALTPAQLVAALAVGREFAEQAAQAKADLFIGGEMGIGNTTSATALAAAELEANVEHLAGPGTGLDNAGVSHKSLVIEQALYLHRERAVTPIERLQCFAGAEIAALVGAYLRCAQLGIPVMVDGFIATIAALYARAINPGVTAWFIYAHYSAEPGHKLILEALNAKPLLDLGLRLGEGSGAAVAVPLLQQALALHNSMATFAEAGVTNKE